MTLSILSLTRPAETSGAPRTPVVVELFTSQGCLSCPPADELLIELARDQPIPGALVIPLAQHVEYWNTQWHDPFSDAAFTRRQEAYRRTLSGHALFTPQAVIDGRTSVIGSQAENLREAITLALRQPKVTITLSLLAAGGADGTGVDIVVDDMSAVAGADEADIWLAVTEHGLTTDVRRGENAFRRFRNAPVVRVVDHIDRIPTPLPERYATQTHLPLDPDWDRSRLRLVAFVQEREQRRILGATETRLDRSP